MRHKIGGSKVGLYPKQLDQAMLVPAVDRIQRTQNADPLREDSRLGDAHAAPSDLHTAVKVYLEHIAAGTKPDARIYNPICIAKMHHHLEKASHRYVKDGCRRLSAATAESVLQAPAWPNVLSLAAAWAFADRIALHCGSDSYQASMPNTNVTRKELLNCPDDREIFALTPSSLCHSANTNHNPGCIVYMGTMRHPNVSVAVPVPLSIAALCGKHPLTWSSGLSQEAAQAGFQRHLLQPSGRDLRRCQVYTALRSASASKCAAAAAPASASECAAAVAPPNALLAGRSEKT